MFKAYIDDSHTTQSAFVLAGYVATAENWSLFSEEWQAILDMKPPLRRFKMSEAHSTWSEDQWKLRLPLMYGTIERFASAGVSMLIPYQEYSKIFAGIRFASNPYNYAFIDIITMLNDNKHKMGLMGPIDFIFDKGNEERIAGAWDKFKLTASPRLKELLGETPTFGNDEDLLPLQAADMLAWLRRRRFQSKQDPDLNTRKYPWVKKKELQYLEMEWTTQRMRDLYDLHIKPDRGEQA